MDYSDYMKYIDIIRDKTDFVPETAIILGSGLGALADEIDIKDIVNYSDIKDFPVSTVQGHKGRFVFGYIEDKPVVIMQGRVHYYEGYSMEKVTLPVRLMRLMGAEKLILTNAAGGINRRFNCGDFMLITDHISTFVPNPLIGKNIVELGTRFPDMSNIFDCNMCRKVRHTATNLGIAARHWGFKVCGISCISNMACGVTEKPLSHTEVQETADRVAPVFKKLIKEVVKAV